MIKLAIGCGSKNYGEDWIHIDSNPELTHLDYCCRADQIDQFFKSNTVNQIYMSHLLAYYNWDDGYKLLTKLYNILKPNGILEISTTDFNQLCKLYNAGFNLDWIIGPLFGKILHSDDLIYQKCVYDYDKLRIFLLDVGFIKVEKYDLYKTNHANTDDQSFAYMPDIRCEYNNGRTGIPISLNIKATK